MVLGVGLVAGWLLSRRLLAPLHTISRAAAKAGEGDLTYRIDAQGPHDELKQLADTFDTTLGRLRRSFASHQRFAANASHELLTPLATTRAILQMADGDTSKEEFAELVPMLRETNERNIRVVRGAAAARGGGAGGPPHRTGGHGRADGAGRRRAAGRRRRRADHRHDRHPRTVRRQGQRDAVAAARREPPRQRPYAQRARRHGRSAGRPPGRRDRPGGHQHGPGRRPRGGGPPLRALLPGPPPRGPATAAATAWASRSSGPSCAATTAPSTARARATGGLLLRVELPAWQETPTG